MKIYAYSKALYSTWLYLEPLRLLCDAGEGLNTFLEGRLLAFRNVALTHAHTDHFTGLQNIFITRLREMEVAGQELAPISVFYPEDSTTLARYFAYLEEVTSRWEDLATLQPMKPGDSYPLQGVRGLYITAHKADHYVYQQTALSYRVDVERWVLRPEMEGLPQSEINRKVATEGREAVTERKLLPLVFYSGDGRPVLDPDSREVSLLLQEATFLEPNTKVSHASLPEAIELFRALQAKHMLLFHLSTRYEFREFLQLLEKLVPDEEERARIYAIRPGNMLVRNIPVPGY